MYSWLRFRSLIQTEESLSVMRGRSWEANGRPMKGFPTLAQVEKADNEQLARWFRFLPSGETVSDQKIMERIAERFEKLGGMTAELSKKIGM